MFCPSCGKEVFAGDRFCKHCGAAQADESRYPGPSSNGLAPSRATIPSATVRSNPKGKRFWRLYTFDWQGECPTCQLVHTSQNATCPIDGSTLVVAFDARKINPLAFPIHTAELMCSKNCGFSTQAIVCNDDGTLISETNLSFRMGFWRTFLHNLVYLYLTTLGLVVGVAVLIAFLAGFAVMITNPDTILAMFVYMALVSSLVLHPKTRGLYTDFMTWCFANWWPFRRTFGFDQATKAVKFQQKLEARAEAAKTARYVERRRSEGL